MNKQRRKEIEKVLAVLESLKNTIEELTSEEQEYADGMPENLQQSVKAEAANEAIGNMEDAGNSISDSIDYLQAVLDA